MKRTVFAVAMLLASSAWAQDQSSPEYIEAKQRLQEGKTLYAQNNIDGARLKFEQACAVLKTPACQRALGLAQFYTQRYLEALGNLRRALDDPELDTVQRKQVTDLMQQAYDKTGHLEIKAPAGAHVRIDDTLDAGNAPLSDEVNVTIGSHTISVQVENRTERKTIECSEGKVSKVDFSDRFPGMETGGGPPQGPTEQVRTSVIPPTGAIITGAVGLVGIGLGIGFGVASSSANSTNVQAGQAANGICATQLTTNPVCTQAESTRQAQQGDAVASLVSYITGGVLVAAAIVWWTVAPRKIIEHKVAVLPIVGPRTGGLGLTYSF